MTRLALVIPEVRLSIVVSITILVILVSLVTTLVCSLLVVLLAFSNCFTVVGPLSWRLLRRPDFIIEVIVKARREVVKHTRLTGLAKGAADCLKEARLLVVAESHETGLKAAKA